MAITEQQRAERQKHIGASEVAALFGLDPFKTAWDIWAEKTGKVDGFTGNEATARGNHLEPAILSWLQSQLSAPLIISPPTCKSIGGILVANLDADIPALGAIGEAKSSTQPDEYGEPGTDQVPDRTLLQVQAGMYCAGRERAYVAVLLPMFGRFDFRIYEVPYRRDIVEVILQRVESFWADHVLADVPPEGVLGSMEVLKRLRREPGTWAEVPSILIERWDDARKRRLDLEKAEDVAFTELVTALGGAEGARFDGGTFTYLEQVQNIKAKEAHQRKFRKAHLKRA